MRSYYLTVHGVRDGGSWSNGSVLYRIGVHEVDEHTAEAARESGLDWLTVTRGKEAPPPPPEPNTSGPLTATDVLHGTDPVADEAGVGDDTPAPPEPPERPDEWPCPHGECERHEQPYKSEPALQRHLEMKHPAVKDEAGNDGGAQS